MGQKYPKFQKKKSGQGFTYPDFFRCLYTSYFVLEFKFLECGISFQFPHKIK